ncbi:MAG: vWA domain-containing protein [Mycobacteriales bacterium]
MARPRLRAAAALAAVLAGGLPLVAQATAPHLTCGVRQSGSWERIPVDAFQPIPGMSTRDAVSAYTVDELRPQDLAATNGATILLSASNGCDWRTSFTLSPTATGAQPFVGSVSSIVSLALLGGTGLAAVQEGSGSASRPHVLVSSGGAPWTTSDSGLPAQGAPRLLRAADDGRTAYLTVSPTASGGTDTGSTTGVVPGLPGGGGGTSPTGLLYGTTDGGASWSLRTGAADLPGGGAGFSALDVDAQDPNRLYGIVAGRLVVSRDGGNSFTTVGSGFSAVTAMGPGTVAALLSGGGGRVSDNGGATFTGFPAPPGITSVGYRTGDSALLVERSGALERLEPATGRLTAVPAGVQARTGSLLGDRGVQSSFHALAGHALLRYVDPLPPGVTIPPIAVGDLTVPPPNPGVVTPAVRNVSLPVGTSALEDFTLDLPKNPTPLDLFFLVDVSTSMEPYIDNLKKNINKVVDALTAAHVNLKVGIGTLGTAPAKGEPEYPDAYVFPPTYDSSGRVHPGPTYRKPRIYERIRAIGDTGPALRKAVSSIQTETDPPPPRNMQGTYHEGQLLALEQMVTGSGVKTQLDDQSGLNTYSGVTPGQQANFRRNKGVRKIVVIASDEQFDMPYGTPTYPDSTPTNPHLDFRRTLRILNQAGVGVFGITTGSPDSQGDMETLARGTHTFAPPGGVSCGGDPPQQLPTGAPLVCSRDGDFSAIIGRVLASLVDRQDVALVPANRTPVLGALDASHLRALDVKRPNRATFSVRVSCVDVKPGSYHQDVLALLRQTKVGAARIDVTCVQAAAAVRPRPVQLAGNPPPPPAQPAVQVVAPPAPPPPATQPQVQPQLQTQVQVQPLTAGAVQEQQELQLALALNGTSTDDDPAFSAGQQLAMVDRRRHEERQALGVLAFAMAACAGLGLARLRARPDVTVARNRR